ncbi:MAG: NADH-quinone oxidoreductase subunit A [Alphaproteobacteria bacterium GM7ARS4]|nr:NADH-quinone oxidoreductase subunit A [Alphaproteobacteria bacterium GM7ARS4]
MPAIAVDYLPVFILMVIVFALAVFVMVGTYVVGAQKPDKDKNAPYECGFEPFDDARGVFNVRFYLVAILFIIFDLEIAFLFPWAIVLEEIGLFGFVSMMVFLAVLTVGFIYEWKKGALTWE